MNNGKVAWHGNYPALVSPFTKDGEIDEKKFIGNIEILISEGIHGCVVSGSNGESWALKGEERLRLFKLALETVKGRIPVIGGTGSIITGDVIELTKAAGALGVSGVMIMPPYYAQPNRREVVAHFKAISDEAKTPILIYNSPKAAGFDVTADVCEELADIEYICGIKQSTPDFVQFETTVAAVGERMTVFTGRSASRGLGAVLMGAEGFVSSFDPHVMGAEGISLFELAAAGKVSEARKVQERTLVLDTALGKIGTGAATMKTAMNILGRPGGYPRRPLQPLTAAEENQVRTVLDGLGLLKMDRAAAE